MAENRSRSMNGDFAEGYTDGKYKKLAMNRGGEVESTTTRDRLDLEPQMMITEKYPKEPPVPSFTKQSNSP